MITDNELKQQLRDLPQEPLPDGLADTIIEAINPRPRPVEWVKNLLFKPFPLTVRPVYGLAIASCLVLFISLYPVKDQNDNQQHTLSHLETVQDSLLTKEKLPGAEASYLIGKGLLEDNQVKRAADLLQRASLLDPGNTEYAYWAGVAHYHNQDPISERESYLRGLQEQPDAVPLLINLGHNYLNHQEYESAIQSYAEALTIDPYQPDILYNIGLIRRRQGLVNMEIAAWQDYLNVKRTGLQACKAVERLNSYGDFDYRTYQFGSRQLVFRQDRLLDGNSSTQLKIAELAPILSFLEINPQLEVNLAVFSQGKAAKAHERALELKRIIIENTNPQMHKRVQISWFGDSEKITLHDGRTVHQKEGLLMFGTIYHPKKEEVTI